MVPVENILFLGSLYIFTVQGQIQTDIDCNKFPQNPLCSLSQINRLSRLEQPQISPEPVKVHRTLDLRSAHFSNARDQRYSPFIPPNNPRPVNLRPSNFAQRPVHLNGYRPPIVPNPYSNFRAVKRPSDLKSANSNRKKRFFFWYSPADILQAKMNLWKNKLQKLQGIKGNPYQWKQPNSNYLPYEEYNCVHGKLQPTNNYNNNNNNNYNNNNNNPNNNNNNNNNNNYNGLNSNKNEGYLNLNGPPIILTSPVLLNEQYTSQNKPNKLKKKKPMKYAVEMEEESSEEGSDETKLSYIRDHAPEITEESNDSDESASENFEKIVKKRPQSDFDLSPNGDRIEFQVQGHNGPKTYIFGFDTGDGKNRQYRLEERMKDGTVKGQYGYYDARGKLRTIKYIARPMEGYTEKHHEMNLSGLS